MDTSNPYAPVLAALVILAASLFVVNMVRRELAPLSGLGTTGQWMLSTALGSGIIAVALKLITLILLLSAPGLLEALIPSPGQRQATIHNIQPVSSPSRGYVWAALPQIAPSPPDNPTTAAKVALGERLFNDKNLSWDRSIACSSCHALYPYAGADGRPTSKGIYGQRARRNAPSVWNSAFQARLFWDGRASTLEEQALGPMLNPMEMGMPSVEAVVARVKRQEDYQTAFRQIFGPDNPININHITAAIAAYERTLVTADSPYDQFVRGDRLALSPAQLRGMALFESVGCVLCHSGPNFSGASLIGGNAPMRIFPAKSSSFEQQYRLTEDKGLAPLGGERGIWRIPSLRNVALTAPYFHNGSVDTLKEAVRIMVHTQLGHPLEGFHKTDKLHWDPDLHMIIRNAPQPLDESDIQDLVAFLHALSSERLARLHE